MKILITYWLFFLTGSLSYSIPCNGRENSTDTDFITSGNRSPAVWIIHPEASTAANQWFAFRKLITLENQPDPELFATIAVDSKYWLYINGEIVVLEGGLKRGPTPDDTYADIVDIGPFLKKGENSIGILVWFFGKDGFSHNNSGLPGLYFSAPYVDDKELASDNSWRVIHHSSFMPVTDDPQPNYRLPESNILFDSRNDIGDWLSADFDDSDWLTPVGKGVPPVGPWNRLVERPIPLWKDYGVSNYDHADLDLPVKVATDTIIRAMLPYNAQVTPGFTVTAPAGKRIIIKTDNYRGGSEYNVRTEYITREGIQEFETPGWMNGHYVHYEFPAGVEIHDLTYRETGYDTEFTGYFSSNDPFYDLLWKKSKRSLYINMRDTYMDCPDRERAQWWGDVTLQLEQSFYAFDRKSDHLARKGILELINWQRADSTIYSPVPAGNWDRELPMQMLASIGYYGIWNYFYYSGDTATVKAVLPGIKKYLHVWETNPEGLVITRPGGWTWGDWGENRDMDLLFNLWYSLALKGFENMSLLLDNTNDALWASETNNKLKESFHKTFWNGSVYRSAGYTGETDDRAHALAVLTGIAPHDNYNQIREVLKTEFHASPYMEKYVLEALIMMGFIEDALDRMKVRFGPMVESELTTLWEGWGIGEEGFGGGSYNHGWSGGPLTLLSRYISGLSPAAPGFSKILFMPGPGHLTKAKSGTLTKYGLVRVSFRREGNRFFQDVSTPAGIPVVVCVPVNGKIVRDIRVNGRIIWSGNRQNAIKADFFQQQDDDFIYFEMEPGDYSFVTRYRSTR
jgi:alpha-L-rhamnosidase